MRSRPLLSVVLLVLLGWSSTPPARRSPLLPTQARPISSDVLMHVPFITESAPIEDDANTVAHVRWNGSALVDAKGNAWAQNGTVPQNAPSPLYPRGFAINRAGAGPFSDANFYSLGAGSDSLDFTGDFSMCIVVQPTSLTTSVVFSNGTQNVDGYYLQVSGTSVQIVPSQSGASFPLTDTYVLPLNVASIICGGRSGASVFLKVNLRATLQGAAGAITPATTTPARVGRYSGAGQAWSGAILEVYFTRTASSAALFNEIQTAFYDDPTRPIAEDANTVAHVVWNGVALVDTKGNQWTHNGAVPQVSTATGFAPPRRPGAGLFSDANYYSLGTGSDVLDFAGDFSCCSVFKGPSSFAGAPYLFDNGSTGPPTAGYAANFDGVGRFGFYSYLAASNLFTVNGAVSGAVNVACFGRAGTTRHAKMNLGADATDVGAAWAVGTALQARIGRGTDIAGRPWLDLQYEWWCSTTTSSDALFTAIQNRFFGHVSTTGQVLTVARATTATAEPKAGESPSLYTWPVNVLRITENGALFEASATNLLLQSEALDSASWTTSGVCTITANQAVFVSGQTTMEKVQCTGVNDSRFQSTGVFGSTTGPITGSVWAASTSGNSVQSVAINCAGGAIATCNCARGDGGACTATILGTNCIAYGTVGATPVRLAAIETCSLATTTAALNVHDGQEGTTSNIGGFFGGAQLEIAGFASSYVPTTTATVARNADAATATNPLPVGPFCVTGTGVPAPLATWSSVTRDLWVFGTQNAANSARVQLPSNGSIVFQVIDAASASKTWTVAVGTLTGSAAHTITACSDNAGTGTVTLDGASQSVTVAGAGTGALSTMGNVSLLPTSGGVFAAVAIKNFKVCRSSNPAKCQ